MNRNGSLRVILDRIGNPDYTLEKAVEDLHYVIDYAQGLEDDMRVAKAEMRDMQREAYLRGSSW